MGASVWQMRVEAEPEGRPAPSGGSSGGDRKRRSYQAKARRPSRTYAPQKRTPPNGEIPDKPIFTMDLHMGSIGRMGLAGFESRFCLLGREGRLGVGVGFAGGGHLEDRSAVTGRPFTVSEMLPHPTPSWWIKGAIHPLQFTPPKYHAQPSVFRPN